MKQTNEPFDPIPVLRRAFELASKTAVENPRRFQLWVLVITVCLTLVFSIFNPEKVPDFQSKTRFLGVPLFATGKIAVGWIAYGYLAIGLVAIGGVSLGGFAIGGWAIGLLALGGLAVGVIASMGGGSVGFYCFGGCGLGGWAYAGQGVAFGVYSASGMQKETLIGGKLTDDEKTLGDKS